MKIYRLQFKDHRVIFANRPNQMPHIDKVDKYFHTRKQVRKEFDKYVGIIRNYGKDKSFFDGYSYSQGAQAFSISGHYNGRGNVTGVEPDMEVYYDVINTED